MKPWLCASELERCAAAPFLYLIRKMNQFRWRIYPLNQNNARDYEAVPLGTVWANNRAEAIAKGVRKYRPHQRSITAGELDAELYMKLSKSERNIAMNAALAVAHDRARKEKRHVLIYIGPPGSGMTKWAKQNAWFVRLAEEPPPARAHVWRQINPPVDLGTDLKVGKWVKTKMDGYTWVGQVSALNHAEEGEGFVMDVLWERFPIDDPRQWVSQLPPQIRRWSPSLEGFNAWFTPITTRQEIPEYAQRHWMCVAPLGKWKMEASPLQ